MIDRERNLLTGPRDTVRVIDFAEQRRPYVVRSAYRPDPNPPSRSRDVLRVAENLAVWVGFLGLAWWVIFRGLGMLYDFALHHPFGL